MTRPGRGLRRLRRAGVFVVVTLTALFALAAPAFAHAALEGASPAPGATLSSSPKSLTLDFSEKVEVRSDGIRVLNDSGAAIKIGPHTHPGGHGEIVRMSLPKLDKGLYTVAWRVVSADAHPAQGAYTFGYGVNASGKEARQLTANATAESKGDSTVGVLFGVMRFGVFVGLALLLGAGWFAAYLWPEGRQVLRVRQLLLGSLVLTATCTVLGFLLQGPYTSGKGLDAAFSSDQISAVWDTRFGKVWMARLVLLVVAALLLRMMVRHRGPLPGWWFGLAGVTGLALSATPGLAGHASTGRWTLLALPADMFHVLGMSIWLGGLVMLAIARTDEHSYARVAERFSGLALGAVVVLVITGTFQSIRQLQPISALWDSNYGRLLIAKLVAFGGVLLIAAWSRRLVHGPGMGIFSSSTSAVPAGAAAVGGGAPPTGDGSVGTLVRDDAPPITRQSSGGHQSRLRRSVRGELIFGAVVLAFTAMLVNTSPPREVPAGGPLQVVMKAGKVDFEVHLDPASSVQPNILHVTVLDRDGLPRDVVEMRASLSMSSRDIPAIDIDLSHEGRGVYFGDNFRIPFPGEWKLSLTAFVTDLDSATASTPVSVGGS